MDIKELSKNIYDCLDQQQPDDEYWSLYNIRNKIGKMYGIKLVWSEIKEDLKKAVDDLIKRNQIKMIKFVDDDRDEMQYGYKLANDKHTRDIFKLMKKDRELHNKLWDMYPNEWILYRSTIDRELIEVVAHNKSSKVIDKIANEEQEKWENKGGFPEGEGLSETFGYPPERRTHNAYGKKIK